MNEQLEEELNKWMEVYKKEEKNLLEKYPLNDSLLNQHLINNIAKKSIGKKIVKKYNN